MPFKSAIPSRRIGVASESILAIAAVLIFMVIILFTTRATAPSLGIYGESEAHILAQSIATSINALSSAEKGYIEKYLTAEWDIEIKDNEVIISHVLSEEGGLSIKGSEEFIVDESGVEETELEDVMNVLIVKDADGIKIREGFYEKGSSV